MQLKRTLKQDQQGAVGMLSVILLTTLVLIFMLSISLQVLKNVRNAKILSDFDSIYYVMEGGLRDARIQLKKAEDPSIIFPDITMKGVTAERAVTTSFVQSDVAATGTTAFITRVLRSPCAIDMENCNTSEIAP